MDKKSLVIVAICFAVVFGWQAAVIVFFLAPLAGLFLGLFQLILRRDSEISYGPFLALAAVPNTRARLLDYLEVDEAGLRELERIAGAALPDEVRRRMSAPADTSGFGLGALPPDRSDRSDRPDHPDEPHRP